ncbi:MAG: anion permease, partial [Parvularculaceae bacterium]|nr:anion permease [Parvularculaceae bacterium]
NWMAFGVPTVLCLIPAAWFVLTRLSGPLGATDGDPQTVVREKLKALGPWTRPEVRTLMAFSVIAFFWIFRRAFIQDLTLFGVQPFAGLTDHVIAIAGAIAMFLIPAGCPNDRGAMILNWSTAKTLPWDVVLLFGGGLSLAAAITSTGLGLWIGDSLSALMSIPTLLIILMLTAMVIMATEVTSNVATAAALMPVVIALGAGSGVDPVALGVPVALAASCAFMFPMATAPNAIAFASGEVSIARMAIIGAKLNVLAIIIITLIAFVVTPMILG